MSEGVEQLEPRVLWKLFSELAEIPRPSKHEEAAAAWVRGIADARGYEVRSDDAGNLVIAVPATPGLERAPVLVLQSHLDMVCEKNRDSPHDFMTDPIRLQIVDGWVTAHGTTLGADNGIGVAAALACAVDDNVAHGPLELLFTVDEEQGLTGASRLDARLLRGRVMLNLDSEEDGVLCTGCAGGVDNIIDLEAKTIAPTIGGRAHHIRIGGLQGGHSGMNIHENRGNAIKILVRLLVRALDAGIPCELARLSGGSMRNAIPREAEATIFLAGDAAERFQGVVQSLLEGLRHELRGVDEGLTIEFESGSHEGEVLERTDRNRLLQLLMVLPSGPLAMSPEIPGLVETSNCVTVVGRHEEKIRIVAASRGSVPSSLADLQASIRAAAALAGARATSEGGYPGWAPNLDSRLLSTALEVCTEVWGRPPEVTAVHAGLECGILGEKIQGMDMLSLGPTILGAHSPDERVDIATVERFWTTLTRMLGTLAPVAA